MLRPLRSIRVWRFSLYYVVVFGAYVALAAWLPKYYVDNYDLPLYKAALLTALFIFPASLLRPVGGHLSDRFGARRVMYGTFGTMMVSTLLLSMPYGHIVLYVPERYEADGTREVMEYQLGIVAFTALVFIVGIAMGVGKAPVYKHIPSTSRTTSARSAAWSAPSGRWAASSSRRCSRTRRRGPGLPQTDLLHPLPLDARLRHLDAPHGLPHAPRQRAGAPQHLRAARDDWSLSHDDLRRGDPPRGQGVAHRVGPRERGDLGQQARVADAVDHHVQPDAGVHRVVPRQRHRPRV
jgi:hypothetical protein